MSYVHNYLKSTNKMSLSYKPMVGDNLESKFEAFVITMHDPKQTQSLINSYNKDWEIINNLEDEVITFIRRWI